MDCKEAKKLIHEYLDGDAELSVISAHLEQCPSCSAYLQDMLKQKELLGTLSAKNAPSFDLAAAKRRKKAKLSRTVSWASAAAAVFVVVLLAGSMTNLFSGAKKEAPMARAMGEEAAPAPAAEEADFEMYAAEEAAPAEAEFVYEGCIVEEEAPAAEEAAPAADKASAPLEEAPAEEAPAEEAPAEEAAEEEWQLAAGVIYDVSQNDLDTLLAELSAAGYHPEMTEKTFVIVLTKENANELNEIFSPYTDKYLAPGLTVYFSAE